MKLSRWILLPAVASGLLWIACGEQESHIYFGQLYDRDADCLDPGTEIDPALAGPPDDAGTCDPICISDLDGAVWISVQCPPYPIEYDVHSKDPECAKAFAAACRLCPLEGGPVETVCDAGIKDASHDTGHASDAGEEAAKDSGHDARADASKDAGADGGGD